MTNDLELDCGGGLTLTMKKIPAGSFMMGSMIRSEEQPVHEVTIAEPFYMGVCPVTQSQYQVVMGANPSEFSGSPDSPQRPVENVSWGNTKEFCQKLSKKNGCQVKLPSEAQWEYCCRAGGSTVYCFGDNEAQLSAFTWHSTNSDGQTHPVGQKRSNAWGLYDIHGNVWEWCEDNWHDDYHEAPADGAAWMKEYKDGCHVLRGGSWAGSSDTCRSSFRARSFVRIMPYISCGFRVVCLKS